MSAVTFDTLEFVDILEKAGITQEHARGIAAAVRGAQDTVLAEYAKTAQEANMRAVDALDSKTEKAVLKLEYKIENLESKIDKRFVEMDAKIELIRKDLTIKIGGMLMAAVGVILAAMKFMN